MDASLLEELKQFATTENEAEIAPHLFELVRQIAKAGEISVPWRLLKPLVTRSLAKTCTEFYDSAPYETGPPDSPDSFQAVRSRILDTLDEFERAPFTLQRICELIIEPKRHYLRCDKFLRGVEKNVLVVTTVDSFCNGTSDDEFAVAKPSKIRRLSESHSSVSGDSLRAAPPETFLNLPLRAVVPSESKVQVHSTSDHEDSTWSSEETAGQDLVANESLRLPLTDDTVSSTTADPIEESAVQQTESKEKTEEKQAGSDSETPLEEKWKCDEVALDLAEVTKISDTLHEVPEPMEIH